MENKKNWMIFCLIGFKIRIKQIFRIANPDIRYCRIANTGINTTFQKAKAEFYFQSRIPNCPKP